MVSRITTLPVQARQVLGKKVKSLRKAGNTPIHLYGPAFESVALQADTAALRRVLVRVGRNRPVSLQIDASEQPHVCFVREVQFDPRTEQVYHVDFLRVDVTQRMEFQVPVHLQGEAPAVRQGASLFQVLREVRVECLPLEAPTAITVNVSSLEAIGDSIRAGDLQLSAGVTLVTEPGQVVVQAVAPTRAEVVEEAPTPEAAAAGEEAPAEGEAAGEEGGEQPPSER